MISETLLRTPSTPEAAATQQGGDREAGWAWKGRTAPEHLFLLFHPLLLPSLLLLLLLFFLFFFLTMKFFVLIMNLIVDTMVLNAVWLYSS